MECTRCGNCCKTYPCHLWLYQWTMDGGAPPKAPHACPDLRPMDDGTWICGVLENARFHVQIGMRPGGWDGLVARLLLVGDGCTATERVRRGELLQSVSPECSRTLAVERSKS